MLNLTASLSVNHNWFGAAAAPRCWAFLRSEAQIIEREFAEFKRAMDAEGDEVWVQRVCDVERINSGLSRRQFAELLLLQAESAVESDAVGGECDAEVSFLLCTVTFYILCESCSQLTRSP